MFDSRQGQNILSLKSIRAVSGAPTASYLNGNGDSFSGVKQSEHKADTINSIYYHGTIPPLPPISVHELLLNKAQGIPAFCLIYFYIIYFIYIIYILYYIFYLSCILFLLNANSLSANIRTAAILYTLKLVGVTDPYPVALSSYRVPKNLASASSFWRARLQLTHTVGRVLDTPADASHP